MRRFGPDIRLGFSTEAGWSYSVEYRTNVESGLWTAFTNNEPGVTGTVTVTNAGVADLPRRFYRAGLLP